MLSATTLLASGQAEKVGMKDNKLETLACHFAKVKGNEVKSLSHVRLFATPWTVAYQAPQSIEFSRQEYWSGLPFSSPGDLPDPGIEPGSPALRADYLLSCQGSPSCRGEGDTKKEKVGKSLQG